MGLQVGSFDDDAEDVTQTIRKAIEARLPDARVEVVSASPGHFEIRVVSAAFAGRSRVQQQQLVYGAIAHLMSGDGAPVHAIDRMHTLLP